MGTTHRRFPSRLDSHKNSCKRWTVLFWKYGTLGYCWSVSPAALWDYSAGGVGFVLKPWDLWRIVMTAGKPFLPRAHALRRVPCQVTSSTWNARARLRLHGSRGVKGRPGCTALRNNPSGFRNVATWPDRPAAVASGVEWYTCIPPSPNKRCAKNSSGSIFSTASCGPHGPSCGISPLPGSFVPVTH